MKPEDQRIAIAEACGWRLHSITSPGYATAYQWQHPDGRKGCGDDALPNYLNSLDAMHEAAMGMTASDRHEMNVNLRIMAQASQTWSCCEDEHWSVAVNSTAPQRAEAFLKALHLWTE